MVFRRYFFINFNFENDLLAETEVTSIVIKTIIAVNILRKIYVIHNKY